MTNYKILKEYEEHKEPIPSYEEYISLINWKEDLTELCTVKERIIEKYENIDTWWKANYAELKEENQKLKDRIAKLETMQYSYTEEEWNTMLKTVARTREENDKLKKMLLKCREKLDNLDYGCEVWQGELTDFINEIDEVLK